MWEGRPLPPSPPSPANARQRKTLAADVIKTSPAANRAESPGSSDVMSASNMEMRRRPRILSPVTRKKLSQIYYRNSFLLFSSFRRNSSTFPFCSISVPPLATLLFSPTFLREMGALSVISLSHVRTDPFLPRLNSAPSPLLPPVLRGRIRDEPNATHATDA